MGNERRITKEELEEYMKLKFPKWKKGGQSDTK